MMLALEQYSHNVIIMLHYFHTPNSDRTISSMSLKTSKLHFPLFANITHCASNSMWLIANNYKHINGLCQRIINLKLCVHVKYVEFCLK